MIYYLGNIELLRIDNEKIKICSKEDVLNYINSKKEIVLDIETCRKFEKYQYLENVYQPGLDPYFSKICMIQLGDENNQYVIDSRVIDCNFLIPFFENKNITKIIHNAQFECKHILHNFKCRIVNIWDTMIVEKLLENGYNQSYSLKSISKRKLNIQDSEDLDLFTENEKLEKQKEYNFDNIDLELNYKETIFVDKSIRDNFINIGSRPYTLSEIEYGANDILLPYQLYKLQQKENHQNWYPDYGIKLENDITFVLAEMSYRGIPFDRERWLKVEEDNFKIYNFRKNVIDNYIIQSEPKFSNSANLFGEAKCNIQWSSPKQVIDLFKSWNICPKEKSKQTGKLEWSVGAKALFKILPKELKESFLKDKFPETINNKLDFTLSYLLFKKSEQLITTFGKDYLKFVHPITGRVHCHFNQLMNTTRLSSVSPNVQQLPRTENFRSCINSKSGELICVDYTAQEVYAAAFHHNSKPLIKFFEEGDETYGVDIHSYMAAKTYSIVYQKDFYCDKKSAERQNQKIITFQTVYGSSEFTLSESLGITDKEALIIQNSFKKGFELEESFEINKKDGVKNGYITLDKITNKRYWFPEFKKMNDLFQKAWKYYPENYSYFTKEQKEKFKKDLYEANPEVKLLWKEYMTLKGQLERKSLNFPIQGLCASMTKLAMLEISNFIWENKLNESFSLILAVHDEIVGECLDLEKKEFYGKLIQDCMEKSSGIFLNGLISGAEPLYSKYWSK